MSLLGHYSAQYVQIKTPIVLRTDSWCSCAPAVLLWSESEFFSWNSEKVSFSFLWKHLSLCFFCPDVLNWMRWREEKIEGTAAYQVCHVTRERRTYVPRADFGVLMFSVFRTEQTRFEFVDVCFWSEWHRYPSWRSAGLYPERPGRHPQQSEEPELELEPGLPRPAGFVRAWPDGWAAPSSDSVWGVFSYSVISQHSSPLIWITWKEGCRVFIGLMYWLCLGDHQSLQQCSQTDLDLLD